MIGQALSENLRLDSSPTTRRPLPRGRDARSPRLARPCLAAHRQRLAGIPTTERRTRYYYWAASPQVRSQRSGTGITSAQSNPRTTAAPAPTVYSRQQQLLTQPVMAGMQTTSSKSTTRVCSIRVLISWPPLRSQDDTNDRTVARSPGPQSQSDTATCMGVQ
jgi:hypothetical protein